MSYTTKAIVEEEIMNLIKKENSISILAQEFDNYIQNLSDIGRFYKKLEDMASFFFKEKSCMHTGLVNLSSDLQGLVGCQINLMESMKGYNVKVHGIKSKFEIFRKEYSQFTKKQKKFNHYTKKIERLEERKEKKERKAKKLSKKEIQRITRVKFYLFLKWCLMFIKDIKD